MLVLTIFCGYIESCILYKVDRFFVFGEGSFENDMVLLYIVASYWSWKGFKLFWGRLPLPFKEKLKIEKNNPQKLEKKLLKNKLKIVEFSPLHYMPLEASKGAAASLK